VYNVVGTVKNFLHVDPGKPLAPRAGAGSRAVPRSGPFIEDPWRRVRLAKIVRGRSASFALLRIPLRVSTKARLLRILRCNYCHQPCIRSSTT